MKDLAGKYIVFEGIDGAGKGTQLELFCNMLETEHGLDVKRVIEPGSTYVANRIRTILKEKVEEIFDPVTELLLFFAARRQGYINEIKPALDRGCVVVSDRGMHSTYAYQGIGRGLGLDVIDQLKEITFGEYFEYDHTVFLDIDPRIGRERTKARGGDCRLDDSGLAFFNRAREGYISILERNLLESSNVILDATKSPQAIALEVEEYFRRG